MLVTADHGQMELDHDRLVDVGVDPVLAQGVAMVAGEPRAAYAYLTDPTEVDAVAGAVARATGRRRARPHQGRGSRGRLVR